MTTSESPVIVAGAVSPHGLGQTKGGVPDLSGAARDCAQCLMSDELRQNILSDA